jgi:ribosome-associated protein
MIQITSDLRLDDRDISERFVRSIGSRSQNVRKEATAVELRLDIGKAALPPDVKARVMALGGRHVTTDGVLIVTSRANRSQAENRRAARGDEAGIVRAPGAKDLQTAAQRAQAFAERARRGLAGRGIVGASRAASGHVHGISP